MIGVSSSGGSTINQTVSQHDTGTGQQEGLGLGLGTGSGRLMSEHLLLPTVAAGGSGQDDDVTEFVNDGTKSPLETRRNETILNHL